MSTDVTTSIVNAVLSVWWSAAHHPRAVGWMDYVIAFVVIILLAFIGLYLVMEIRNKHINRKDRKEKDK